jgi:hypothetical protein
MYVWILVVHFAHGPDVVWPDSFGPVNDNPAGYERCMETANSINAAHGPEQHATCEQRKE